MSSGLGRSLIIFGMLVLLCGCGEEASAPAQANKPQSRPKAQPVKAEVAQPEEKEAEKAKPVYVYNPAGQRDPFVPLLRLRQPVGADSGVPLTPLQKFELSQFRLVGVLVGKGEPRAMVNAPGGKSFILKRGVKIGKNNGTVVAIDPEAVNVEEKYYDFTGAVRTNVQQIKLPPRQGVN